MSAERAIADMPTELALPRRNGELVFDEPWESRAFGIAVSLSEQGHFAWDEFRNELVATIAAPEQTLLESDRGRPYYEHWLASLERLLVAKGMLMPDELQRREEALQRSGEDEH